MRDQSVMAAIVPLGANTPFFSPRLSRYFKQKLYRAFRIRLIPLFGVVVVSVRSSPGWPHDVRNPELRCPDKWGEVVRVRLDLVYDYF